MIPSFIRDRTFQFYNWEQRGRGWQLAEQPIELEPAFIPFFIHATPQQILDDGKRPSFFSSIVTALAPPKKTVAIPSTAPSYEPFVFSNTDELHHLRISLPQTYSCNTASMEQLLQMLSYCNAPISFEIIATKESIIIQIVCREQNTEFITHQIKAHVPGCIILDTSHDTECIAVDDVYSICMDFGLKDEFMRPLATKHTGDSYQSLFATLDNLKEGERISLQILFIGVINSWAGSIIESVSDNQGNSFFYDAPEMPALAKEKVSAPLFAVTIRLLAQALQKEQATAILERACVPFLHSSISPFNALVSLGGSTYDFDTRMDDILERQSHRSGMLLNAKELVNLLHFPTASLSKKLQVIYEKTKAVPPIAIGHEHVLGMNIHEGISREVSVNAIQRLNHMHVIGATGTGKSTLLLSLIKQDIEFGHGCAILDPHGDLIDNVLPFIPKDRLHDVIIIDPSDSDYPIAFNILSAHSDIEKEILASDLVSIFKRLSTSWGDQMNSVFANAILAFLESTRGGTLLDLRRFLIEKAYREQFLMTVKDEHIVYYWQKEYPLLRTNSIGSILTRLDSFLRPKVIRNMVSQQKSLDFEMILDTRKILLVKLSQGLIGAENSYLLGSFIVSKLQQAAMARQTKAKELRTSYYTYIDEFQHFTTHSMSLILSGARKYGLGLILAHQSMQQLQKEDSELAGAVLANAGTRICLRLGEQDARTFTNSFASFTSEDLQRLNTGHAIARIERNDFDFTMQTIVPEIPEKSDEYTSQIINYSRSQYASYKADMEAMTQPGNTQDVQEENVPKQTSEKQQSSGFPVQEPIEKKPRKEERISELLPQQKSETIEKFIKQKEQSQHRALQTAIKKLAEDNGYKATIEQSILNGTGKVDVSLEKNGKRTACEISVSTGLEWEFHNIEKCIAAGYDVIILCAIEEKLSEQLKEKVVSLDADSQNKIIITDPQQLYTYFETKESKNVEQEVIKGYRVKVEYKDTEGDARQTQDAIARIVQKSMKK